MTRAALALLFALGWPLFAAPVPPYRPRPLPAVSPGRHILTFGSLEGHAVLYPGGAIETHWAGSPWYGSWHWDAKTRTLHLRETRDGATWCDWSAKLDAQLTGSATWCDREIAVTVRPDSRKE